MKLSLLSALNKARANRAPVVVVTNLSNHEQQLVASAAITGHELEESLHRVLATSKSAIIEKDGVGYFLDAHIPPVRLYIIGAVHIAQALAPMARMIDLDVTVIDPRESFAAPLRFADEKVLPQWPDEILPKLGLDRRSAVVALTHDPKIDDLALTAALKSDCFYIGALGSRKSHARRIERLAAKNFGPGDFSRINAPIGLDIGAISPAEIAVAILGEIVAAMRQKPFRTKESL